MDDPLSDTCAADQAATQKATQTTTRTVACKPSVVLFSVLLALALFLAGNLVAHERLFDLGGLLGFPDPQAQGMSDAAASAPAVQVGARVGEVGALLDAEALYGFTQGDLDAAAAAAIRSLLEESEDSHAIYYTAEEYAAYQREQQGEYAGIGIVLTLFEERSVVLQVYADSPAAEAGIAAGDVVLAIDGQRKDWTPAHASEAIRRPAGESVTIIWERRGQERTTTFAVGTVTIPTVVSHLIEQEGLRIGYISLRRFNEGSSESVRAALEDLEAQGAEGYILDLRGNPGGFVQQAVQLTSLFVAEGEVVRVEERSRTEVYEVTGEPVVTERPLVLLVNGFSASASELSAAALQDHGRAVIVGETTYGKGTVQNVRLLSFGGALRYTIAHYLSPAGRVIEGQGVVPDILVSLQEPEEGAAFADSSSTPTDPAAPSDSVASSSAAPSATLVPTLEELITDNLGSDEYRYRLGADRQLDAALAHLLQGV